MSEDRNETEKMRLIAKLDERRDIIMGDDGFFVFWPEENNGAFSAWMLRAMADELDRRNEPAQVHLDKYFSELKS